MPFSTHTYTDGDFPTAPQMNRYERDATQFVYDRPKLIQGTSKAPVVHRDASSFYSAGYIDVPPGQWMFLSLFGVAIPAGTATGRVRLIDDGGVGVIFDREFGISTSNVYTDSIFGFYAFTAPTTRIDTMMRVQDSDNFAQTYVCQPYAITVQA